MKTHTPGPWHQHSEGGKTYASVRSSRGQIIADCGSRSDIIAQSNSKLIAAAPELLDVLTELVALQCKYATLAPSDWARAQAAIAKAQVQDIQEDAIRSRNELLRRGMSKPELVRTLCALIGYKP